MPNDTPAARLCRDLLASAKALRDGADAGTQQEADTNLDDALFQGLDCGVAVRDFHQVQIGCYLSGAWEDRDPNEVAGTLEEIAHAIDPVEAERVVTDEA